jgi:type II secretory pathway predicted ATPase ExeA
MYENFYALSGKPFQLSPDPAFYFGSKGHTSAYAYLKYGVYQGEGFLVITGEVGAGKTTLVRALLEELDVNTIVAAQIVSTQLDADDLLRSVAKTFGIRTLHEDSQSLGAIEDSC